MGLFNKNPRVYTSDDGEKYKGLTVEEFESFAPAILGLGDITSKAKPIEAVCVVFDLAGFTNFCKQVDPHLAIPEYLSEFLNYLFSRIRSECEVERHGNNVELYSPLPFFVKFMGDGLLLLWNTEKIGEIGINNVPSLMQQTCSTYESDFLTEIRQKVVEPPSQLRCGVARGRVLSVGNGEDFVGPCINIATRLQKLSDLRFCCSRRGFDFDKHSRQSTSSLYIVRKVSIRGIGENELVYVVKTEFDSLSDEQKSLFLDP